MERLQLARLTKAWSSYPSEYPALAFAMSFNESVLTIAQTELSMWAVLTLRNCRFSFSS